MHPNPTPSGLSARQLATGGNALLAAMPTDDLVMLAARCRRVVLPRDTHVFEADEPASAAYFVESGVLSAMKAGPDGQLTEISLIGPEGFLGASIVLGAGQSPYTMMVQTDRVVAIRVPAPDIQALFNDSSKARELLAAAIHLQIVQIAEGAVSNVRQQINARLARWLLLYRDRLGSGRLDVTHEFMALMVGAQRTRITEALHQLESAGAIIARRGYIIVRDEAALRKIAGSGYGVAEREAARLAGRSYRRGANDID